MPKRLADGRREELLDGVMRIVSTQGFSHLRVTDLAPQLHCSVSTLYKIAPNKDSLIVLAISRWGETALMDGEVRAGRATSALNKARIYWLSAAEHISSQSHAFRLDLDRFESTRLAYRSISERFVTRLVELLDDAVATGEIEPTNTRFLAHVFRQIALVVRDETVLGQCELTAGQAMLEVERILWAGMRTPGNGRTPTPGC